MLIYDITDPQTGGDIWALPLIGKAEPRPVVRTAADEHYGTLSPDGRWLAYISNETGDYEVYAESFPATGFKRQVSTQGGFEPQWRRDGKELFYLAPNQTLMAVGVKSTPTTLEVSPPRSVVCHSHQMDGDSGGSTPFRRRSRWSTLPDQQRNRRGTSVPVTIVLNWSAALKK